MRVAEPQMYRETAFERDGRDSKASNAWAEIFGLTFEHQALPDSFDQLLFFQEIIAVAFHILEHDERIDIHAILDAAHGPL